MMHRGTYQPDSIPPVVALHGHGDDAPVGPEPESRGARSSSDARGLQPSVRRRAPCRSPQVAQGRPRPL